MQKYSNGEKKIMVTNRAFEIIYKDQGFFPVVDEENLELLKVDELRGKAKEKGVAGYENMKKVELINTLLKE